MTHPVSRIPSGCTRQERQQQQDKRLEAVKNYTVESSEFLLKRRHHMETVLVTELWGA